MPDETHGKRSQAEEHLHEALAPQEADVEKVVRGAFTAVHTAHVGLRRFAWAALLLLCIGGAAAVWVIRHNPTPEPPFRVPDSNPVWTLTNDSGRILVRYPAPAPEEHALSHTAGTPVVRLENEGRVWALTRRAPHMPHLIVGGESWSYPLVETLPSSPSS